MSQYAELLEEFEVYGRSAAGVKSLMQHVSQRLHEEMTRYNWVGFYFMEVPTFDTLVLGPYVGSFMPTLRIPLDSGLCGAAATTGETVAVNNVAADPRYLGSDLAPEQKFIESCAALVGRYMEKEALAGARNAGPLQ